MNPTRISHVLLLCVAVAGAAHGQQPVPDAPGINAPATAPVPATRPNTPAAIERRQWSGLVEPGETVPALTTEDKFLFPLHEEFRPIAVIPVLVSGGYGVLRNSDPRFGVDAGGFGERMGAAALRQGSIRFFSDGLLPALFHEDPRYYRRAVGTGRERTFYAVTRVFVTQRDSGSRGFDFSNTLGRGMAAALTMAYYPEVSVRPRVVFQTWGVSLAGLGGIYIFEEFLPDVKHRIFRHSQ